jgi:predicted TPR repeat methyltransferase
MNKPYSNNAQYIARLEEIDQQIKQNQLQEAVHQLNSLAKGNAHDPRLFLLGSRLAEAAGNPDGRLTAARKAHELGPDWPEAALHLAQVLADRNDATQALSLAEQAVQQTLTQNSTATKAIVMLVAAAAMAQRLKQHAQALQWLHQAENMSPEDLSIRYQIGVTLANIGQYSDAIAIFTDLLNQRPASVTLLDDRLRACLADGQTEQAIQDSAALLALEPDNDVYQYYFDIARGQTPKTQPSSLVSMLFDGMASQFDQNLVVQLKYKLPREVAAMIHAWHPERKVDVLDLGCGTGLLGACLGPVNGALIGVDLSQRMIDKAAVHKVYHRFHRVNILDALVATPSDHYDVITALDVLIYVGDLEAVVPNAHRILTKTGRFVFSCEAGGADEAGDYLLRQSGRYVHQRGYVQGLLDKSGFADVQVEDCVLRYEANLPVHGFLVVARRQHSVA